MRDEKSFQILLQSLLKMKRGVLAILFLKTSWDSLEILLSLTEPLRWIA